MSFLIRDDIEPKKVEKYETKKQTLLEEVESIARNLVELKDHRRGDGQTCQVLRLAEGVKLNIIGSFKPIFFGRKYFLSNWLHHLVNHIEETMIYSPHYF